MILDPNREPPALITSVAGYRLALLGDIGQRLGLAAQ
jgi:hypothetical protein